MEAGQAKHEKLWMWFLVSSCAHVAIAVGLILVSVLINTRGGDWASLYATSLLLFGIFAIPSFILTIMLVSVRVRASKGACVGLFTAMTGNAIFLFSVPGIVVGLDSLFVYRPEIAFRYLLLTPIGCTVLGASAHLTVLLLKRADAAPEPT
ncbi:MAG: hypothetical protein AAGH64_06210 [Planctomycetota bacterium]